MPYYKEKDLLFIHIPKTGGTNIENCIIQKHKQTLYSGKTNNLLKYPYNNISLQHQFYTTIYNNRDKLDINFNNIKIFSVVRNPYNRIISDLFWYNLIKKDYTPEQVYDKIVNDYLNRYDLDNHNQPQYKYITDNHRNLIPGIKIFKCENLNEMNEDINKFIGFDINIKQDNANKDYSKYLNKDSIDLINKIYKKDFELFNYDLK